MVRINPIDRNQANESALKFLDELERKMPKVPNLIATMAHSPAVATAYLGFTQSLSKGVLPANLREKLALVVGESNKCDYCVSAHSAFGKKLGLDAADILNARRGQSSDSTEQLALEFARIVVETRGKVSDGDIGRLRDGGFTEAMICEIVAHVGLNIFTNYFNHVAATEVDFPKVSVV